MITIYFKTTQITIKFLEQCILSRIMLVSKTDAVVNKNFIRHPTKRMGHQFYRTGTNTEPPLPTPTHTYTSIAF